jgi:DNA polymerase-3 subunit epsilon
MILTDIEGNVLETYYQEMNPGINDMDPESQKVHGLSLTQLKEKQQFSDLEKDITSFLNKADLVVAYNVDYDLGVLFREYQRIEKTFPDILKRSLDSMQMIKKQTLFEKGVKAKNPKLSEAAMMLGLNLNNIQLHNALDDTNLLKDVFFAAMKKEELLLTKQIKEACEK